MNLPGNFFLLCMYGLYYDQLGLQPLASFAPVMEDGNETEHSQCFVDSMDLT